MGNGATMNENQRTRKILKLMRGLVGQKWLTEKDHQEIRERILNRGIDQVLMILRERLERSIDGNFDPEVSRKLDAIRVLLED